MANLTNTQMEILANYAVDKLEKRNQEQNKLILENEEYKNFEDLYTDDTMKEVRNLVKKYEELSEQIDDLETQRRQLGNFMTKTTETLCGFHDIAVPIYRKGIHALADFRDAYLKKKKDELYPGIEFNRAEVLNKLKAQILINQVKDAKGILQLLDVEDIK